MSYIAISIILSTIIILIFRGFTNFKVNTPAAIVVNYFFCALQGLWYTESFPTITEVISANWFPIAIMEGILFILAFITAGLTVQHNGINAASVSGKLSLILTVIAAFFLYNDAVTATKILGICFAMMAVMLVSFRPGSQKQGNTKHMSLPLALFFLSGAIEILLNYAQVHYIEPQEINHFLIIVFALAGLIGSLYLLTQLGKNKNILNLKNLIAGLVLGAPNYFSMYFIVLALERSGLESSVVFPLINIGIVALAAICSFIFFREKLSRLNLLGLALALAAIALIGLL